MSEYRPQEIERKWQARWAQSRAFEVTEDELLLADSYETNAAYRRFEARLSSGGTAWVYADARFEPRTELA